MSFDNGSRVTEADVNRGFNADHQDWQNGISALIPSLRAFASSLSRNAADADDLVQETLARAWAGRAGYPADTSLKVWMFTMLRNTWYADVTGGSPDMTDGDGRPATGGTSDPARQWRADPTAIQSALNDLPPDQREAIVMVGAAGLSWEEAARIAGVSLDTLQSRVNAARHRLARYRSTHRSDRAAT